MWLYLQTLSSEALPENTQQNVCTRKGKYHIYHIVGSKLCSKSIIQSDSFSITVIFLNCLFLIILYFYSFFIDLLIKEGKEKLKTIFFVFQKIAQSDDLTRSINLGLRKDDDNEGKVSSLLRFFSLKQINAVTFDWLKEMRQKKWRFHRPAMPFLFFF